MQALGALIARFILSAHCSEMTGDTMRGMMEKFLSEPAVPIAELSSVFGSALVLCEAQNTQPVCVSPPLLTLDWCAKKKNITGFVCKCITVWLWEMKG